MIARWCNGSTHGSEPCSPSSNLGRAALNHVGFSVLNPEFKRSGSGAALLGNFGVLRLYFTKPQRQEILYRIYF